MSKAGFDAREVTLSRVNTFVNELFEEYAKASSRMTLPSVDPTSRSVHAILKSRRARSDYFCADLFSDPAWDMLLDLYHATLANRRVSVSALCIAANVPATTALRYINALERKKYVTRQPDPHDGRRSFIVLSEDAVRQFELYFAKHPVRSVR